MDSSPLPTVGQPAQSSPLAQHTYQHTPASEGLEVVMPEQNNATATASSSAAPAITPVAGAGAGVDGEGRTIGRTTSTSSTKVDPSAPGPSRSGTLRKTTSLRKRSSLIRRTSSGRSLRAGSMRGLREDADDGFNNIFHTPVPTTGNPTEVLATRFQAWRKLLKDLIAYFREIQSSYESRSKALLKISNAVNNTQTPPLFLSQSGLDDALVTLRNFHKASLIEANKAKDIEEDVITQLNGLRNDLNQKIKEIKSLSGDFKNSVEREKDTTRKAVAALQDALNVSETDPSAASGKGDPFIVRLAVDRQVEKQIEEENYLHRAYLNLEGSGRELESIVVGEIQKAYNAYVGILRREIEHGHETIDDLRSGPIAMPKDHEWTCFVERDEHFVNPNVPLRKLQDIYYPEKFNPSASEIRAGMLERKSKYLKSYTPGWYVLSPTHLHEFKSGDHIHMQQPVMSLYLLDQKLGSRSQADATSHKFSVKGRQTGAMHRGHSWVFRAESYDTMMAWYEAIKILTEKSGAERNAFVRKHARSVSVTSHKAPSGSSDGVEEDEADAQPFAANNIPPSQDGALTPSKRPEPGGRFPSDLSVNRGLQVPNSPSSNGSQENSGAAAIANLEPDSIVVRDYQLESSNAAPMLTQQPPHTTTVDTTHTVADPTTEATTIIPVLAPPKAADEEVAAPATSVNQTTSPASTSATPTAVAVAQALPVQIPSDSTVEPVQSNHEARQTFITDAVPTPTTNADPPTNPYSTSLVDSEINRNAASTGKMFYTDSKDEQGPISPGPISPGLSDLNVPGGFPGVGTRWSSWG